MFKVSIRSPVCFLILAVVAVQPGSLFGQWDAPSGYYIGATGTGQALKSQLGGIMATGHIQRRYGDYRFSAAIHDQDPNNPANIFLVYNRASVSNLWDAGVTWNREHVWPQSRQPGDATNSTTGNLGDPHALRPVAPGINSSRSNRPFGFGETTGPYRILSQYWFPGDFDKGDIARSLFYSDTRWSSLGLSLTDDFPAGNEMGNLSSMIEWHFLDPPDEFERRRNHTIYSEAFNPEYFTNNRNAFVDHPEFVWSVYVDQANDSTISIDGGTVDEDGGSTVVIDFGRVIVGSTEAVTQPLTIQKNGADGTFYSVLPTDAATSDRSGNHNAFRTNGIDSRVLNAGLEFDSSLPGTIIGLVRIDNLDVTLDGGAGHGGNDADDFIGLGITNLAHANASFSSPVDQNELSLDLGQLVSGQTVPPLPFEIFNLGSSAGAALTARLDLVEIVSMPPDSGLSISGPLFEALPADESEQFAVSGMANGQGSHTATFAFILFDENVAGSAGQSLILNVNYEVVEKFAVGDVNRDGSIDLLDVAPFIDIVVSGEFQFEADINGDGFVNLADVHPFVKLLTSQ